MPYTTGPYQDQADFPSPTATSVSSSRKIDLKNAGYELDANGNYVGMDDVDQLVIMAVLSVDDPTTGVITPRELNAQQQAIAQRLRPLQEQGDISNLSIAVENHRPGRTRKVVDYVNESTGLSQTYVRDHT